MNIRYNIYANRACLKLLSAESAKEQGILSWTMLHSYLSDLRSIQAEAEVDPDLDDVNKDCAITEIEYYANKIVEVYER